MPKVLPHSHNLRLEIDMKFKAGDRISVSWTVCKSILNGKRRHQKKTKTATGVVIDPMPGDKDGRVRIKFDEMD